MQNQNDSPNDIPCGDVHRSQIRVTEWSPGEGPRRARVRLQIVGPYGGDKGGVSMTYEAAVELAKALAELVAESRIRAGADVVAGSHG